MRITYRPAAVRDIQQTAEYIRSVLKNPSAAKKLQNRILQSISLLKENPYMGMALSGKYENLNTDIRYIIVSNQLIFYHIVEGQILIVRVLDGRTDYLTQLFSSDDP